MKSTLTQTVQNKGHIELKNVTCNLKAKSDSLSLLKKLNMNLNDTANPTTYTTSIKSIS